MSLLAWARNKAFWTLDFMRGGLVANAYHDIETIDKMNSSNPLIKEYQDKNVSILINRATSETLFYKQYEGKGFDCFPIINKNTIRNNQDSFLSNRFQIDDLVQMSTSGSTGTPFVCYQNIGKKKRVNAEIIYYSEKVGYKLGENLSYIRTIVKQNKKTKLKQFIQNQHLINCMSLNDDGIQIMLNEIKRNAKNRKVTLLGYGSTYTAIKDYSLKNSLKSYSELKVTGVISGSDMLFDETRSAISSLFGGVPVVSRYSNEENGVLGQDEGLNNVFTINEADYIVEICDDEGIVLEDGKLGHIVVTDLFNYAMPMIRYDTGDIGAIRIFDINGRKKKCICDFSGRNVDVIYDSNGDPLSPHVITNYMWNYPEINQFQLIQRDKGVYILKLNIPDSFARMKELEQTLYDLLGKDATLSIKIVSEIPVLASGKRRYIVNETVREKA